MCSCGSCSGWRSPLYIHEPRCSYIRIARRKTPLNTHVRKSPCDMTAISYTHHNRYNRIASDSRACSPMYLIRRRPLRCTFTLKLRRHCSASAAGLWSAWPGLAGLCPGQPRTLDLTLYHHNIARSPTEASLRRRRQEPHQPPPEKSRLRHRAWGRGKDWISRWKLVMPRARSVRSTRWPMRAASDKTYQHRLPAENKTALTGMSSQGTSCQSQTWSSSRCGAVLVAHAMQTRPARQSDTVTSCSHNFQGSLSYKNTMTETRTTGYGEPRSSWTVVHWQRGQGAHWSSLHNKILVKMQ